MLDAAETATRFAAGASRQDLDSNQMLTFALVRAVEVIGEAAGKLSNELKGTHCDLPWHAISGMRNRLIHAYFDVDLDRLWDTVTVDLPSLIERLRALLPDLA
jgi:uncharacterized protein with HEPN domain